MLSALLACSGDDLRFLQQVQEYFDGRNKAATHTTHILLGRDEPTANSVSVRYTNEYLKALKESLLVTGRAKVHTHMTMNPYKALVSMHNLSAYAHAYDHEHAQGGELREEDQKEERRLQHGFKESRKVTS